MGSNRLVAGALSVLGAAILAAYYVMTANAQTAMDPAAALDMSGPVIEISVAGEANGVIRIKLFTDKAPQHVERFMTLAGDGAYDNIVFHRVINGFMAQTGDVEFGKLGGDINMAGRGGSGYDDLPAEFSDVSFERGIIGMARAASVNSANSQFFIMLAPAPHLNGEYTVVGQVVEGFDVLDAIKLGTGRNGAVVGAPDVMTSMKVVQ